MVLRRLVVACLCNLSGRATEVYLHDSPSARWFLRVAVDEAAPDQSALTAARRRIIWQCGKGCLQGMPEELMPQMVGAGSAFGQSKRWSACARRRMCMLLVRIVDGREDESRCGTKSGVGG